MINDSQEVSVLLSSQLQQRVEEFQTKYGKSSLSEAIASILTEYFDMTDSREADSSLNRIETLERQVASLTQRLDGLTQAIARSGQILAASVEEIPSTTSASSKNSSSVQPPAPPATSQPAQWRTAIGQRPLEIVASDEEDDEIYDEPDEILFDFLPPEELSKLQSPRNS